MARSTPAKAGEDSRYRPEIDGLRAIAVMSVVIFHAGFTTFSGGYTGVDIFFVISGYLITRKIVDEVRGGGFTFTGFYVARLRRLFPALMATLVLTFIAGALVMSPEHMAQLAQSTIFAALPLSNFYFWQSVGYWDLDSNLKPLLHIWSLSLEEQFYFVWPALLVFLLGYRRRFLVPLVLVLASLASLAGTEWQLDRDPSAAFYMPWFRVCEFGLGALVIWAERWKPAWRFVSEIAALAGLALILYAVFTYPADGGRFPGLACVPPALGAALLIYAGATPLLSRLWNNPVGVGIGRISYSVYLVHWPLVVLYAYWRFVPLTEVEKYGLVLASLLAAWPLYHFVEQRFRRPPREAVSRRNAIFMAGVAASTVASVAMAAAAWAGGGWRWRLDTAPDRDISAKLTAPCVMGKGLCDLPAPKVVLIGDSHAGHYWGAFGQALKELGVNGRIYDRANNCALFGDAYPIQILGEKNACRDLQPKWFEQIRQDNPRIVILASFWEEGISDAISGRLVTSATTRVPSRAESRALFERKLAETIDLLTAQGRSVVLMGDGPVVNRSPSVCYDRPTILGRLDCSRVNVLTDPETQAYAREVLRKAAAGRDNVFFFDTYAYLCRELACPLGERNISFYLDRHHLSGYGAMWLQHHAFGELAAFMKQAIERE